MDEIVLETKVELFRALGPVRTHAQAKEWALVLQSMAIASVIRMDEEGWFIWVENHDFIKSENAIQIYEKENRNFISSSIRGIRKKDPFQISFPILLMMAMIAIFYSITGPYDRSSIWFDRGTSIAEITTLHEPWRAVTSLTLHADTTHLLGNLISGSLFASALASRIGYGTSGIMLFFTGFAGNYCNALWHYSRGNLFHGSVGFSTAIFGAIGLLAILQWKINKDESQKLSNYEWVKPIIGGIVLFGMLGTSSRADLGAHIFGFLFGILFGLLFHPFLLRKQAFLEIFLTVIFQFSAVFVAWGFALKLF